MLLKIFLKAIFILGMIWLTGWFLSNQINPMLWPVYGKLTVLIILIMNVSTIIEE